MVLERNKAYYVNDKLIAFNYGSFYYFLLVVLVLISIIGIYVSVQFLDNYVSERMKGKEPVKVEIRSEEVIKLTDLIVKNKVGNGAKIIGYPGQWIVYRGGKFERLE